MVKPAQLITAKDRDAATVFSTDPDEITELGDKDSEDAWSDWVESLSQNEASGTIHVHRLPVDADGNPNQGKGSRMVHLGSWPHQLYTFDGLIDKIRNEFVKPGETIHAKITGMVKGKRGVMFNQIVSIARASTATSGGESTAHLFRLMQEGHQQNANMLREIIRPNETATKEVGKPFAETAKEILALVLPVAGTILSAVISRPAKPKSELVEMIAAMGQLRNFMDGKDPDGSSGDESTTQTIIKAVAPALPQLLQAIGGARQQAPQPQHRPPAIAAPVDRSGVPTAKIQPNPQPEKSSQVSQPISPEPQIQSTGVTNDMLMQLKPHLEDLASLAEQNQDPAEVAELIATTLVPSLNEQMQDALGNLLESPRAFSLLHMISPKVKIHAEWFEKFRQALDAKLFPEGDTE